MFPNARCILLCKGGGRQTDIDRHASYGDAKLSIDTNAYTKTDMTDRCRHERKAETQAHAQTQTQAHAHISKALRKP